MSGFDPAKYAEEESGFDPGAYVKEHGEAHESLPPEPEKKEHVPSWAAPFVGALPPAIGAAFDVAGDVAGDAVKELASQQQFKTGAAADLLKAWQEAKAKRQKTLEQSRSEHPWLTGGGQVAAMVAPGMAISKVMGASPLLDLAAQSTATRALYGENTDPASIAGDVVAGKALGAGVSALAGPGRAIGNALQVPQKAVEYVAGKLGGTKLGEVAAGTDVQPIGQAMASRRVAGLRHAVDVAEIGRDSADALSESIRQLGGLGAKRIAALNPTERGQVAEHLASLWQKKGATVDPAHLVRNWDEVAPSLFLNAEKDSVQDLLRGVNTRDVSYLAALGSNIAKRSRVIGTQPNMVPQAKQMLDASEASHNEYLVGRMTRGGEPSVSGQGQFHVDPGHMQTPQDQLAQRMAQAAHEGRADIDLVRSPDGIENNYRLPAKDFAGDFSDMATAAARHAVDTHAPQPPGMNRSLYDRLDFASMAAEKPNVATQEAKTGNGPAPPGAATEEAKALLGRIGAEFSAKHKADTEAIFEKARAIRELLEQVKASRQQGARDQLAGREAAEELRKIATGRQAIGNIAGLSSAAGAGGGLGGLAGAVLGLGAGKSLGRGALKGIDLAGHVGQKLSSAEPLIDPSKVPDSAAFMTRLSAIADLLNR